MHMFIFFKKMNMFQFLQKLKAHGISGKIIKWIKNWLSDRKQRVVIKCNLMVHAQVVLQSLAGFRKVLFWVPCYLSFL